MTFRLYNYKNEKLKLIEFMNSDKFHKSLKINLILMTKLIYYLLFKKI